MKDLVSAKWMYLKAALFVLIGLCCFALILAEVPRLRIGLYLILLVWSMCRAYYFAFYVIERYIDPSFKFAGLGSALCYLIRNRTLHSPDFSKRSSR
jgi:hypothetical protein